MRCYLKESAMNKIQLRPPPPSQEIEQEYASSPCLMHQAESSPSYWLRDEDLTFLNGLLTQERNGTKSFAEIGKAADLRVADLVLEMELLQASFCVFLREAIEARGGKAIHPPSGKKSLNGVRARPDLMRTISIASRGQKELAETIQKGLPKLLDPRLRAALEGMQKVHHGNIERLRSLLM